MADYTTTTPQTPRNRGDYDAPHMSPVTPQEDFRTVLINRVSWGAVFSGVAVAMAVQFILNLLGLGVGATSLYGTDAQTMSTATLSSSALLWWACSGIIAAGIGGFVAGRLAGDPRESTAGWHGVTAWAVSSIFAILLVIGGAGALVGGTLNVTGIADTITVGNLGANGMSANGTMAGGANASTNATTNAAGNAGTPAVTTDTAGNVNGVTLSASEISNGALICVVALILGAVAAWFCGRLGMVEPTITAKPLNRRQLH